MSYCFGSSNLKVRCQQISIIAYPPILNVHVTCNFFTTAQQSFPLYLHSISHVVLREAYIYRAPVVTTRYIRRIYLQIIASLFLEIVGHLKMWTTEHKISLVVKWAFSGVKENIQKITFFFVWVEDFDEKMWCVNMSF